MTHDHCHCTPPPLALPPSVTLWGLLVNKVNKQGKRNSGLVPSQGAAGRGILFLSFLPSSHMPSEAGWTVSCPDHHSRLPRKNS